MTTLIAQTIGIPKQKTKLFYDNPLVQRFATDDGVSSAERRHAAEALLVMSRSSYDTANGVFRALASDPEVDVRERRRAGAAMVEPGRARAEGLALLKAMTSNDFAPADRAAAWIELAGLHSGYLDDALSAAEVVVRDEAAEPAAQRLSCELLLRESAEHGDLAVDVLRRLVADPSVNDHDRALSDGLLASRWFSNRAQAGDALESLLPEAEAERRVELAGTLRLLDPRHEAVARRTLLDILSGDGGPVVRLHAAEAVEETAGIWGFPAVSTVSRDRPVRW